MAELEHRARGGSLVMMKVSSARNPLGHPRPVRGQGQSSDSTGHLDAFLNCD